MAAEAALWLQPAERMMIASLLVHLISLCIRADKLVPINKTIKLDTSNERQMDDAHKFLSHNMAAINFWLLSCIISVETRTYPKRLIANAWVGGWADPRGWLSCAEADFSSVLALAEPGRQPQRQHHGLQRYEQGGRAVMRLFFC